LIGGGAGGLGGTDPIPGIQLIYQLVPLLQPLFPSFS